MELIFRKYFWAVNLAFLTISGVLSASIANAWVGAQIAAPVQVEPVQAPSRPQATVTGPTRLHLERTARFLGIELPREAPPPPPPREPVFDPNAEPVRSSLRLTLIGTMVANRPEWSLATLRDESSRETAAYFPGDQVMGAEILEIERLRVIIRNQGRKEYIAIGEPATAPTPAVTPVATAPTASTSAPAAPDAEVTQIDENSYEISRDELDKQLSNLNAIATQARIVPSFKNGVANGFKLFSIRPGSIYQKIGIQNGDVIRKLNGYEINSPDKALEVYARLKESSQIEIEIERRGQTIQKSYVIR